MREEILTTRRRYRRDHANACQLRVKIDRLGPYGCTSALAPIASAEAVIRRVAAVASFGIEASAAKLRVCHHTGLGAGDLSGAKVLARETRFE